MKELLAASSPRASAQPGDEAVRCAGSASATPPDGCWPAPPTRAAPPASATCRRSPSRPEARGQGLGKAVTAALTRQLFDEGNDVVTLGMYADNPEGRALYDALGFRDDHPFTSGPLVVRGRW